jgi:hypothetical protein
VFFHATGFQDKILVIDCNKGRRLTGFDWVSNCLIVEAQTFPEGINLLQKTGRNRFEDWICVFEGATGSKNKR